MNGKNVKQIAAEWNLTERQVQTLCKKGVIIGAEKFGRDWIIPDSAIKPIDKRTSEWKIINDGLPHLPMPKKSPFLDMTNIYHTPGKAEECAKTLSNIPEAKLLFEAEIAYSRGEFEKVYEYAKYFLSSHSGCYAMIAGGMLLAHCAMWKGDVYMWHQARKHICEIRCINDTDYDILTLSLAAIDSSIRDISDFPSWFKRGSFELLPNDALPAAKVFYIKYLMISAQELAKGTMKFEGVSGLGLMRMLPYLIEPMISQAIAEKTIMVELYLRLLSAIAYHNIGDRRMAIEHLDKAVAIALPDMLLGALAEHRGQLGVLLDERVEMVNPEALKKLKKLHKILSEGWHKLHNNVLEKNVFSAFTVREREITRLAAFGLSDKEISSRLNIAVSSVKTIIATVKNKTGATKRSALGLYI